MSEALEKIKILAESIVKQDTQKAPAPSKVEDERNAWVNHVAVLTGVLAALAGFLTVRTTTFTNNAIYESNQAVLSQTEASDAWAEYQADSIKARMVELQLLPSSTLSRADKSKLSNDDKELRDRQPKLKQEALVKLEQRKAHLDKSMKFLGEKDLLGYAGMAAQLGIALASIAALTRKLVVFHAGIVVGVVSIFLTAYTLISSYLSAH